LYSCLFYLQTDLDRLIAHGSIGCTGSCLEVWLSLHQDSMM
jgi:hypothetical protein